MGFGAKTYTLTKADIDTVLTYDVDAHKPRHADSGADQVDADDLVAGADPQSTTALAAALAHASRHASGQADVVTPAAIAAVASTGAESIDGLKTFTTIPQVSADPTNANDLARKGYVDPLGVSMWAKDWDIFTVSADPLAGYTFHPDAVRFQTRDATDEWLLYTSYTLDIYGVANEVRLLVRLNRGVNATYTPEMWVVISDTTDPEGNPAPAKVGFRHFNNQLYAVAANDTTQTLQAIGALGAASAPTWLEMRYINDARVEYYINGDLVHVETTNVPSSGELTNAKLVMQVKGVSGQLNTARYCYISKPRIYSPVRSTYITDVPGAGQWSGLVRWGLAGENLAKYDVCYRNSAGDMRKAQADAAATMPGLFMALEAITSGASGKFLCVGIITNSGWSWTVGADLMVSDTTAGGMTETAPADTGEQVQRVAVADSATTIYFKPDLTVLEIA